MERITQDDRIAALGEARAHWEAKGVRVLADFAEAQGGEWVSSLVDTATGERVELDLDAPGPHLAVHFTSTATPVHTATGQEVDYFDVYGAHVQDRPEGSFSEDEVHEEARAFVNWYCLNPGARGWTVAKDRDTTFTRSRVEEAATRAADLVQQHLSQECQDWEAGDLARAVTAVMVAATGHFLALPEASLPDVFVANFYANPENPEGAMSEYGMA